MDVRKSFEVKRQVGSRGHSPFMQKNRSASELNSNHSRYTRKPRSDASRGIRGKSQDVPPPTDKSQRRVNFIEKNKKVLKKLQFEKQKEKYLKQAYGGGQSSSRRTKTIPKKKEEPVVQAKPTLESKLETKFETMEKIQENLVKKMSNLMSFLENHCDDCPSFKEKLKEEMRK